MLMRHAAGSGGPPVVLGHSLGTSGEIWSAVASLLEDSFDIFAFDLPGHGASDEPPRPYRLGEVSDRLVEEMRARGVNRFSYAGLSIGGVVGLDLAIRYPDLVDRVAVISAGARIEDHEFWRARAASVRQSGTEVLLHSSRERWFSEFSRSHDPERVEWSLGMLAGTNREGYALAAEALVCFDGEPELAGIRVPVLAVAGAEDRAVPASVSEELARRVPNGRFMRLDDAAHAAPLEQPEALARELRAFFLDRSAD